MSAPVRIGTYVVRTAHHGGGIVSKHPSIDFARTAAIRARLVAPCDVCQVVVTVSALEYPQLPAAHAARNLNQAARN